MAFTDILFEKTNGVAWITINRPEVRNAFRARTVDELIVAFRDACDLSIAADTAVFGQVGPRVGSVDPGFGTAYLARVNGEKKAREIWFLCRQYSAQQALEMGLVNKVVPAAQLRAEVEQWCAEMLAMSPTAPSTQIPITSTASPRWASARWSSTTARPRRRKAATPSSKNASQSFASM